MHGIGGAANLRRLLEGVRQPDELPFAPGTPVEGDPRRKAVDEACRNGGVGMVYHRRAAGAAFEMRRYCQRKQEAAVASLNQMLPIPEELSSTFAMCAQRWTTDGIRDWKMIHYCYERQHEAWESQ